MYQRSGHCDKIFVNLGDKVKKGQVVATVGNGNGQYVNASHEHADFPLKKLNPWTAFVFGMTKEQVKALYADPKPFRPRWYHHMGWGFLEYATYGTKKCFHPGEDWNGVGAGDSDKGLSIEAKFDGEVVYCYNGTGTNSGWGKLLVIKKVEPVVEVSKVEEVILEKVEMINVPIKTEEILVKEAEKKIEEENISVAENKIEEETVIGNVVKIDGAFIFNKLLEFIKKLLENWRK